MFALRTALDEYETSHRNPLNERIHFVCVPVILFTTLGLLWCVPVGSWLGLNAPLAGYTNLGSLGVLFCAAFYARLSPRAFFAMAPALLLSVLMNVAVSAAGWPLALICAALWIAAWLGQFYGHKVEGKKPSFVEDLSFLLIGPLFVIEHATGVRLSSSRDDAEATH